MSNKEIDMMVGIMNKVNPWDCKTWDNYYKKCAEEILTKLKENQVVIAEGKVGIERDLTAQNRIWDIGIIKDGKVKSIIDLLKDYDDKKVIILGVEDE